MAYTQKNGAPHYILRESCIIKGRLGFRNLFDIGPDPSLFIRYAGYNAFYFDEKMEEVLAGTVDSYAPDILEDLFWPWVRPDIRRSVDTFRSRSRKPFKRLTRMQKDEIARKVNSFDKRRAHFLKFGVMDQGAVENMPPVLFREFPGKSRDEIEQWFMRQEFRLKARELKSYVYAIFDIQRFFQSFMAKKMPQAMDQEKVDNFFVEEICRVNAKLFDKAPDLDPYMIRYAVMFFDHPYADSTLLNDFVKSFMAGRRSHRPPPPKSTVPRSRALEIFSLTHEQFKAIGRKGLTKRYRSLARKLHPDTGGSHEKFVQLNGAYETLLEKIG